MTEEESQRQDQQGRDRWVKTIPPQDADPALKRALDALETMYPPEYAQPIDAFCETERAADGGGIVLSHSLIPGALYHAFATFRALMSPDLPLTRRQHEMITTVVSVTNRCVY